MKSAKWVVSILVLGCAIAARGDQREETQAELEAIKKELKPLRKQAYLESDVIEARRKLDAAYREYWDVVRAAMIRLDPASAALIEKDIALRKEAGAISSGSRAEDYEKKAAGEKASAE